MSPWHVGLGVGFIALALYSAWSDARPLFLLTARPELRSMRRARTARRKAWRKLLLPVVWVLIGVGWLTSWNEHWFYVWIMGAGFILLVSWDLTAWLRDRKKRRSDGQPVPMP
jgi:predicted lysophospholipase L1 biosynthesis ABC-type transport system permease subunit